MDTSQLCLLPNTDSPNTVSEATTKSSRPTCITRNCGRLRVTGKSKGSQEDLDSGDRSCRNVMDADCSESIYPTPSSYADDMFKLEVEKDVFALKVGTR